MRPCHELDDSDCHWHSTGIGPMRIAKFGPPVFNSAMWLVWRLVDGPSIPCGLFLRPDQAERIAKALATLPDEAFSP